MVDGPIRVDAGRLEALASGEGVPERGPGQGLRARDDYLFTGSAEIMPESRVIAAGASIPTK